MICRAVLLCAVAALCCVVLLVPRQTDALTAEETCLGIPILSEAACQELGSYRYQDHSEDLRFQREHLAVDKETSVIYISQQIGEDTTAADLAGEVTTMLPGSRLYFAPDPMWQDLDRAVREGHTFRLLVTGPGSSHMAYDVVFTPLPVACIYGQYVFTNEDDRSVWSGRMVFCDPMGLTPEGTGLQTSHLQWHIRGKSSSIMPKKPWKLSLKYADGKNKDMNLLGLGADDDWLLNPMNMEDSNIRERLFMDLWNEMAMETDYNAAMSTGRYMELVVNGEYQGLYLLQRRVDDKYLELEDTAVLMKGTQSDDSLGYSRVSPQENQIPQEVLDSFLTEGDCSMLSLENFVDVSLFLQFFSAEDNCDVKNMFYLFEDSGTEYTVSMIPWDTDMSLGSRWESGEGFCYDYEGCLSAMVYRKEMEAMYQLHPRMYTLMQERWNDLRKDVLHLDNITGKMDSYLETLDASGAVARDQEKWGLFFEGEDTLSNLYRFVEERLSLLDNLFLENSLPQA